MPKDSIVTQVDAIAGLPLADQDKAFAGQVEAMVNAGRWIVRCPDDKAGRHFAEVEFGQEKFRCPGCYGDLLSYTHKKRDDGNYDLVQDMEKRIAAAGEAKKDGREYDIIFPAEAAAIFDLLRYRPAQAMNWLPGESIELLTAENSAHQVSEPTQETSIVEGTVE